MPNYDYHCEECNHEWEEQLLIAKRNEPLDKPCVKCYTEGSVKQKIGVPLFAYDNVASKGHTKKTPDWLTDKMKVIKEKQPKANFTIPG
jgi:putative FmdB family regulatory protein